MGQTKYRLPRTTVVTSSANDEWIPATDFAPAGKIVSGRGWLEMNGRFNGALVKPAYQTANDPRSPDAAIALPLVTAGGYADSNGFHDCAAAWTSMPSVAGKTLVRFGWIIKTGGSVGGASVRGVIQVSD